MAPAMMAPAMPPARTFDPDIEAQLDRWVAAKRDKDFATADAIRSDLRSMGVEPDTIRPSDRDSHSAGFPLSARGYDPEIEAKISRWSAAKRLKDFATADALRSELRSRGVEPDDLIQQRPSSQSSHVSSGGLAQ